MKIAYITKYDALDIHYWSGTGYYISKTLENQNNILDYINSVEIREPLFHKTKRHYLKLLKRNYSYFRTIQYANEVVKLIAPKIKSDSDIIFSPGSIPLALLEIEKPKVIYTDACFAGIINFYKEFSDLPLKVIEQGHYLEKKALDSASLILYSSDWAADTAIKYYNINPNKIKVIPFGANIENDINFSEIKSIVLERSRSVCNLLFIGVDWKRKGGQIALETARLLNKEGLKTKLHIVGVRNLPIENLPEFAENHGFISKTTLEGRETLSKLFCQSHFLIVPSRAEAYGLVFAEASSYGLPSLATSVGGIPTVVTDDVNGKLFSLFSNANEYASYVHTMFMDASKYQNLAFSSFYEYKKRLSWSAAGETIQKNLSDLL